MIMYIAAFSEPIWYNILLKTLYVILETANHFTDAKTQSSLPTMWLVLVNQI